MARPLAGPWRPGRASSRRTGLAVLIVPVVVGLLLAGCSPWKRGSVPLSRALGADLDDLDPASLALAASRTRHALQALGARDDASGTFELGGLERSFSDLSASAAWVAQVAGEAPDASALVARLLARCRAWPASEPAKVTGYYEPLLAARRRPDARFRYPLYRRPSTSQMEALERRLGRVPTRADIDGRGVLRGLGLELAWVDDPVSRFFLHVQGSGRLEFGDGTATRVGYAGTNELEYVSVGREMLERGLLRPGAASATAMQAWLRTHPRRRDELLFRNPRYVFFRDNGADGPVGALGATLVAGRSVATDAGFLPRGAMLWLRSRQPVPAEDGSAKEWKPVNRFTFAQDAGAAIRGPARLDLFVGSGEEAGRVAGGMNEAGEVYVVLCRPPARRPSTVPRTGPRRR